MITKELKEYFSSMEKLEMYCPICKEKLEFKNWKNYVDDLGNNSYTTFYKCINNDCELNINNCEWDYQGNYYSGGLSFKDCKRLFPDNNYAAFNSISKKHGVEIYKNGLKKKTYLHPIFCLFLLKPFIEYNYKSDYWGRILKKSYKLKFLKYSKTHKTYSSYYTSGLVMLLFTFKEFKRKLKQYEKNNNKYIVKEIVDCYVGNDKRWWKVVSRYVFNIFYKKEKQQVFKHKRIWDILSDDDINALCNYLSADKKTFFIVIEKYDDDKLKDLKKTAYEVKTNKNLIRKKKLNILKKYIDEN